MNLAIAPSQSPSTTVKPAYTLTAVRGIEALRAHVPAWDDLASHAAEPNPFYESWNLLPAAEQFAAGLDLRFLLVYQPRNAQRPEPVLCGFFPLVRRRLHALAPVAVLESWRHLYCFLTTPLTRTGHTAEVVGQAMDWMAKEAGLWRMERAGRAGVFGQALTQECYRRHRPLFPIETYARALLVRNDAGAEAYLHAAVPNRRRKDFRRKARLLASKGKVEYRVLRPDGDVTAWADEFLHLEASGWKGCEGTAMLNQAGGADYFRAVTRSAAGRGQLMMLGLYLNDRPMAMKCNFLSGAGASRTRLL